MKPKEKSVTAQDVQSSLYYIHVDSIEDHELLMSDDSDDDQLVKHDPRLATSSSSKPTIWRKPMPCTSRSAFSDRPEPPPRPLTRTNGSQIARKPVGGDGSEHRILGKSPPLPDRVLLGPRPMQQHFPLVNGAALQNVPDRKNMDMRRWSEQPASAPPQPPPRPDSIHKGNLHDGARTAARNMMERRNIQIENEPPTEHCWDWEKKWEGKRPSDDMARRTSSRYSFLATENVFQNAALTMIRRYDGHQWNTSRIVIGNDDSISNGFTPASKSMSIEIMTAGYSKFGNAAASSSDKEETNAEDAHKVRSSTSQGSYASSNDERSRPTFQRLLHLSGNMGNRNEGRRREKDDSSLVKGARSSVDFRGHGQQSSNGLGSPASGSSEYKAASARPYHFESPWNGSCDFSTGIAGRSMKCKHSYPLYSTNVGPGVHSMNVSELRFNLPSSKALGTPTPKSLMPGTPREAKRSSMFSRHQDRGSTTPLGVSETIESGYFGSKVQLDDRLDLSLGQEHAGGGFGGKQAKLGKLIIENEGLQMLDLIVAANMALWWKVYERMT